MNFGKTIILFILLFCLIFSSCKKYEDGPLISLRSKTERVANKWRIEKALDNGNDVTGDFDRYDVSFSKSGDASLTAHYVFLSVDYDYTTSGKWQFADDKEKIILDFENDLADASYFILRLKENELWVRQENTNLELHLETN